MRTIDLDTLDRRRAEAGLTVKEVAETIGVSYTRLWRALRPSLEPEELRRLDALLDTQERRYITTH
jgi:transcriptional regulator with XRE-family HTH domain